MRTLPYLLASIFGIGLAGRALAEGPLYELDPFDQITLDENNGSAVLKVKPLDLPDRRLPAKPQPDANLVIRLVDQPDKKYEVAWGAIRKVVLFEQMLLDKANELAGTNDLPDNLDRAYDYFRFLEENYSRMPGLAEAHHEFLFKQAKAFFAKQKYRNALGVLRELYRRSPQRAKLDIVMGAMTEKLVEQYAATTDYASIRAAAQSGCLLSPAPAGGEMGNATQGRGRHEPGQRPAGPAVGRFEQGGRVDPPRRAALAGARWRQGVGRGDPQAVSARGRRRLPGRGGSIASRSR